MVLRRYRDSLNPNRPTPRRGSVRSFEADVLEQLDRGEPDLVAGIAAELGMPAGNKPMSDAALLERYMAVTNPEAADAIRQVRRHFEGIPPEQAQPMLEQFMPLLQPTLANHPNPQRVVELLGQGDWAGAASVAERGYFEDVLLRSGATTPEERIRVADKFERMAAKHREQQPDEMPEPVLGAAGGRPDDG